tara:strand:+ start:289 stop:2289 length:2001 start_codon:yes stop_codon:yes gene_type:complete
MTVIERADALFKKQKELRNRLYNSTTTANSVALRAELDLVLAEYYPLKKAANEQREAITTPLKVSEIPAGTDANTTRYLNTLAPFEKERRIADLQGQVTEWSNGLTPAEIYGLDVEQRTTALSNPVGEARSMEDRRADYEISEAGNKIEYEARNGPGAVPYKDRYKSGSGLYKTQEESNKYGQIKTDSVAFYAKNLTQPNAEQYDAIVAKAEKDHPARKKDYGFLGNIANSVGNEITRTGDKVVAELDRAIDNPLVQLAAQSIFPALTPYVTAYNAIQKGEISASDLVSLGLSGFNIPDAVKKAANVGASIVDGKDPVQALAGAYGADFAKELGLDKAFSGQLDIKFGEGTGEFINSYVDINQAAADLVGGKSLEEISKGQLGKGVVEFVTDTGLAGLGENAEVFLRPRINIGQLAKDITSGADPYRAVANQFGDDIANYIGADDTNMQALGFAGVETIVGLGQGKSASDAVQSGAKEYYDREGGLPNIGGLANLAGLESDAFGVDLGFDWDGFTDSIGIDINGLTGSGLNLPTLSGLGIDLGKFDFEGASFKDFGLSLPELSSPDFAGIGNLDFANLDFKGTDFRNLDIDAGELPDFDIDFQDLNIGDIPMPNFLVALSAREKQEKLEDEEENLIAQQEIDIVDPRNVNLLDIGNTNPLINPLLA